MKMKLLLTTVAFSCFAVFQALAVVDNVTSKFTLGSWTSDIAGARAYAKEKGTYFLHLFANNQGGCGMCNGAANALFNKTVLKEWAKANDIPLVVGDTITGGAATEAFERYFTGSIALPALAVVDGATGNLKIAMDVMHSGTTMMGENVYPKNIGAEAIILGLEPEKFLDPVSGWLGYVLGRTDDKPTISSSTGTVTSPTMHSIVADILGAEDLYVHGMWDGKEKGYGTNSLSHVCYAYGTQKCKAHDGDQFDWYQVSNAEDGKTYRLVTPYLVDERKHGYACVFNSKNQLSNIYTNRVFTFDSVTNAATQIIPMESLRAGVSIPSKDEMYIVFTRPDVDKMDTVELTYTFTLQEAPSEAFYFDRDEELILSRTNMAGKVVIYRTNAGRESEVDVDLAYAAGGVYRDDYCTLMFAADEACKTNTISLRSDLGYTEATYLPDGVMVLELEDFGGEMPTNGSLTKVIRVEGDAIGNGDGLTRGDAHAICLDGTTAWAQTGTRNLNSTAKEDWIVVSNVTAGATYYLSAKQTVGPTDVNAKVTVYTNGVEMATYTAADFENVSSQMFTVAGALNDGVLEICVSRDEDATVRFEYELKLREVPQVSFTKSMSAAEVPSLLPLEVRSTLKSSEAFPISVTWETLTTNVLAKENVDFAKVVATTNIAVGANTCTIEVPVLENLNAYSPARQFLVRLDESADGEYTIGLVRDVIVTLAADVVGNKDGATTNTAHQVTVAKTTAWAAAGERNLNKSVTNDWVKFSGLTAGTYRLGVELVAPTNVEAQILADAQVTLMTNGVAWKVWTLADVATKEPTFEITDEILKNGLTDATMFVLVSRDEDETVRLEYNLQLRALPVISFEASESAAEVPSVLTLNVKSTLPSSEDFPIAFAWGTTSMDENATAGVDFEGISTASNIAVGATICTVEVSVLENQTEYSPARQFVVQLGASKTGDYLLGATTNVVVKLDGDEVGNGEAGSKVDTPYDVAIADTKSWAKAGVRNLNSTVTNDWIAFAPVAAGTYRLGAELVAPKEATVAAVTNAQVTIVTNGAAWISYSLADVATEEPAFEITEEILNELTDNKLLVSVTRSPDDTVRLEYDLMLRAWAVPELEAAVSAAEINDTNTTIKVTLTRGGEANDFETKITVRSQDGVAALAGREYEAVDKVVTIPAETNAVDFAVTLIPETNGVWRGNRAFTLEFDVERAELYKTNDLNATIKLKEVDAEFEAGDSAAESAAAPAVTAQYVDAGLEFARTLHGADTNDFFTLSGAKKYGYYSFEARTTTSNTAHATGMKLIVTYPDGTSETMNFPVEKFEEMMMQAGDIKVQITRDNNSTEAAPVSVGYTLKTGVRYVPRYQFATAAITTDDTNTVVMVSVDRLDNTSEASSVQIVTSNLTAEAGTEYVAVNTTLEFAAGETNKVQAITIIPEDDKIYTGNRAFEVYLAIPEEAESNLGEKNVCAVTLKDADSEIDSFDTDDDDRGTTRNIFSMARTMTPAGERRLNGSDLVDWYKFQNVSADRYYKFGLDGEPELNNCTADEINVSIYADGFTSEDEPTTNVTFAAFADGAVVRLAEKTTKSTDILVKVWREAKAETVSVAYNLTFREQPPQTVTFATNRVVVSELADAAYIDVVCGTDSGEALDEDVVATLTFEDGTANENEREATAPADYDATTIELKWAAGTVGGVQHVRLPLTNYGTDWKGDRGYTVSLNPDEDTDIAADGIDQATIWILEKDTPTYGTIAQTVVNGETLTKTTTLAVREGDVLPVEVTLADGISSVVTGEWTFVVGKVKTVVSHGLFVAEETAQTKTFDVTVPETAGFQMSQSGTVTFAIKAAAKTVSFSKTGVTSFKLTITDKNYAGAVAKVAKEDATKPAFRASASAWFLDTDGAYRAVIPAAGSSVLLTTTVTGPGKLNFNATIPEGCVLTVKSTGSETLNAVAGANSFAVTSGTRTVTFTLAHTKGTTVAADEVASISDVEFVRDDAANTYGTFVGAAQKEDAEGLGTVTVAANGRMSGKFQFAGETWTFSATGGWDETGSKDVTAKCKGQTTQLSLSVDATSGRIAVTCDDMPWSAALYRNAWSDKPKSEAMVELAEEAPGYYTVALPDAAGVVGSGYLTLTIGGTGSVKASGKLADGRAVSLSGVLTEGGIRLFTAPSVYRGGYFATTMAFDPEDLTLTGEGAWVNQATAAPFERTVYISGGWYDKTVNLQEYYESGLTVGTIGSVGTYTYRGKEYDAALWAASADIPVELAFTSTGRVTATEADEGADERDGKLFTMNINRATGVFSGYLRAEYDVDERTIRKSTTYRGVLTPVRFDTSNPEGRGFFLMNNKSYDFTIEVNE